MCHLRDSNCCCTLNRFSGESSLKPFNAQQQTEETAADHTQHIEVGVGAESDSFLFVAIFLYFLYECFSLSVDLNGVQTTCCATHTLPLSSSASTTNCRLKTHPHSKPDLQLYPASLQENSISRPQSH